MYYQTTCESPIGILTMVSDGTSLVGLWTQGQQHFMNSVKEEMVEKADVPVFNQTKNWLKMYFHGEKPSILNLKLAPQGSKFRQQVWRILCEIPYGKVTTYGDIAKEIARKQGKEKMSAQAVGGAVGHNPISIIIPCHRVIGRDGSMTGYAGGIDKKKWLLKFEGYECLE